MTTSRRFFSGDNLEQAVMQAARHHNLLPDQVAYRLIEKRHGFLKIRRGVVIEVDPEAPAREEGAAPPPVETAPPVSERSAAPERAVSEEPISESPAPEASEASPVESEPREAEPAEAVPEAEKAEEPVSDERPRRRRRRRKAAAKQAGPWHLSDEDQETEAESPEPDADEDGDFDDEGPFFEDEELDEEPEEVEDEESFELAEDLEEGAGEAIEQLLEFVDLQDLAIEIREGEDRLEIELSGEGKERLLEDDGALLLALEHLVPRLLRGIVGRSAPCRVDCAGFHEERERRLEDVALDAADEVRRRHRPQTLAPMSPEERRIVHLTLAEDPDVRTESQGRGFFKRVTVSPVRHRRRGIAHFDD